MGCFPLLRSSAVGVYFPQKSYCFAVRSIAACSLNHAHTALDSVSALNTRSGSALNTICIRVGLNVMTLTPVLDNTSIQGGNSLKHQRLQQRHTSSQCSERSLAVLVETLRVERNRQGESARKGRAMRRSAPPRICCPVAQYPRSHPLPVAAEHANFPDRGSVGANQ